MTFTKTKLSYDVASALSQGQRDSQEDAVIADFPLGGDMGFAVLADGMGGHAAGDVASKIVVTEVFSELKLQSGDIARFEANMPGILSEAMAAANACVGEHADRNPKSQGMGATLVAPVVVRDRLYWISVGDSPLYLYRDGALSQLNEDHSLAGQIDVLVEKGLMASEAAENHPDRHCLTSVLIGAKVPRVDCPDTPIALLPGDIIVAASDGLQFLDTSEIAGLIEEYAHLSSAAITHYLMRALDALDDPHQDNTSVCVIKVTADAIISATPDQADPEEQAVLRLLDAQPDADEREASVQPPRPTIAADAADAERNPPKITVVARKTMNGLSMLYHFKRPSEKTA